MKSKTPTLNQLFRRSERQTKWLGKLAKNASKQLTRAARFVSLTPASLKAPKDGEKNRIELVYTGTDFAADLPKINRALGADLSSGFALVQFSRIEIAVTLTAPTVAAEQRKAA